MNQFDDLEFSSGNLELRLFTMADAAEASISKRLTGLHEPARSVIGPRLVRVVEVQ